VWRAPHPPAGATGAYGKHLEQAGRGPYLACQQRIALTCGIAGTQQQAPRVIGAHGVHHFAAQGVKRGQVQQQHALAREPDQSVFGGEADLAAQIGIGG
jgi:hypothetical protein